MLSIRPLGYKFIRQKPIGPYIADFYCSKLKLVIEIDGDSHQGNEAYDSLRDEEVMSLGIQTLRFTNEAVLMEGNSVYEKILQEIQIRERELKNKPPLIPPSQGENSLLPP